MDKKIEVDGIELATILAEDYLGGGAAVRKSSHKGYVEFVYAPTVESRLVLTTTHNPDVYVGPKTKSISMKIDYIPKMKEKMISLLSRLYSGKEVIDITTDDNDVRIGHRKVYLHTVTGEVIPKKRKDLKEDLKTAIILQSKMLIQDHNSDPSNLEVDANSIVELQSRPVICGLEALNEIESNLKAPERTASRIIRKF